MLKILAYLRQQENQDKMDVHHLKEWIMGWRRKQSLMILNMLQLHQKEMQDFGDLTVARGAGPGSCSSSTRGLWGGGRTPTLSM